MLAGYESRGCSAGGGSLYRWIPVQIQVSSALCCTSASLLWPRAHVFWPCAHSHRCTCVEFAQLQPQGKEGSMQCPRVSPTLCWGPSTKEEKEGAIEGGMEWTSSGLIKIQIPKYCVLYKSLKKKVGRDFRWSPGLTTKGESIRPVTVQRYLCSAWLWKPLMPNYCLHRQPVRKLPQHPTWISVIYTHYLLVLAMDKEDSSMGQGGCSHQSSHLNMTPHQPNHAGLPPQKPWALAEGPHGLVCAPVEASAMPSRANGGRSPISCRSCSCWSTWHLPPSSKQHHDRAKQQSSKFK